ncbi:MAG TPA: alpha/beta hydrolase [Caulobacteraceae bacterium]|jgi:acetyl esterase
MGQAAATHAALEPGVRFFVEAVLAETARLASPGPVSIPEARRIAEIVRSPWREGGPLMTRTTDHMARADGREVRVRILEPDGALACNPALVYLHGGGWTLFSLNTHDRLMREYAARSGLTVVGVDYSLSPEARFPVALEEAAAVLAWLAREGANLGIDESRLAIGGDSAGANLALAAALKSRDAAQTLPLRALLLNYGAFDTRVSDEAARDLGGPGAMLTANEMAAYWANYLRSPEDAADPLAAPLRAKLAGLPPVFLAAAGRDLLREQSVALAGRLKAAGVAADLRVYPAAAHSFLEAVSVSPLAARALDEAAAWLREIIS